jgi:hypothetical protein
LVDLYDDVEGLPGVGPRRDASDELRCVADLEAFDALGRASWQATVESCLAQQSLHDLGDRGVGLGLAASISKPPVTGGSRSPNKRSHGRRAS